MSFLSFLFYQFTVLSSRAVDGRRMYSRVSVVGKASIIGTEISPTPPLIFAGSQMCEIWHHFQHHANFFRPRLKVPLKQTLKHTSWGVMIALCSCRVG